MSTFINVSVAVTGVYLIITATTVSTPNLRSAVILKTIPMLLGLVCVFCSLVLFGVIPGY